MVCRRVFYVLLKPCLIFSFVGRLSDILGRKGAMLLALSLFGMPSMIYRSRSYFELKSEGSGTLLCGFAPSMEFLIAARALAGMGGGG